MPLERFSAPPVKGGNSPWDTIQHTAELAVGIVQVHTAGHGGFWISDTRRQWMPLSLGKIETFAGGNWYEEDCDWAIVVMAFPDHFTSETCHHALLMAKHHELDPKADFLAACRRRASEYAEAAAADRSEDRLRLMEGGM